MPFSEKVKEDLLVKCNRSCCLCHKYCGTKIEVHHIIPEKEEGGSNREDNGIPLCFDCHADVRAYDPKHPRGKKFTPKELKRHKERWIKNCSTLFSSRDLKDEYKEVDKKIFGQFYNLIPIEFVDYLTSSLSAKDWLYLRDIEDLDKVTDFLCRADKEFFSIELFPVTKALFKSIVDIDSFFGSHHTIEIQNDRHILYPNWKRSPDLSYKRDDYNEEMRMLAKNLGESYYSLIRTFRALFPEFVIPDFQVETCDLEKFTIKATFARYQSCSEDELKIHTKAYCRSCKILLKDVYGPAGAYGGIKNHKCDSCGLNITPRVLRKAEADIKSKIIKEYLSS